MLYIVSKSGHLELLAGLLILCSVLCSCSLWILKGGCFSLKIPLSLGETFSLKLSKPDSH